MTCKDCILEPKCILRISFFMGDDELPGKELTDIEKRCKSFKNKSDFVEVVRCEKCKHGDVSIMALSKDGEEYIGCYCNLKNIVTDIDDFCSYGERK